MNYNSKDLIRYLVDVFRKGSQIQGHLACLCGCETFFLFKREKTNEEKIEEIASENHLRNDYWPFGPVIGKDKDGKTFVRKEFLWFKWKKRPFSEYVPSVLGFQFVSAKCEKCGREIVLFDERLSPVGETDCVSRYGELGIIKWEKTPTPVECIIEFEDHDYDGLRGFTRLRIYKIVKEKKRLFFEYET